MSPKAVVVSLVFLAVLRRSQDYAGFVRVRFGASRRLSSINGTDEYWLTKKCVYDFSQCDPIAQMQRCPPGNSIKEDSGGAESAASDEYISYFVLVCKVDAMTNGSLNKKVCFPTKYGKCDRCGRKAGYKCQYFPPYGSRNVRSKYFVKSFIEEIESAQASDQIISTPQTVAENVT